MPIKRRDLLAFGILGLVQSACASRAIEPRFDWIAHPTRGGISAAERAHLRAIVQAPIDEMKAMGALTGVAKREGLVLLEAQGRAREDRAMSQDAIFRMMSSTKPVTAVAVLTLMDEGRLTLDDPVSRYIPSFANPRVVIAPQNWQVGLAQPEQRGAIVAQLRFEPAAREITIKDLLTHTSGLSTIGPAALINPPEAPPLTSSLADHIPNVGSNVLNFQPGARWSYSALHGMDTLLRIVEIVSGMEAEAYLRARVFEPLGMCDTHFRLPPEKQERLVKLYERDDGAWRELAPTFSGAADSTYCSGGGGLLSTAQDFLAFQLMLLNDGEFNGARVLSPGAVALMRANHVGDLFAEASPEYTIGMGFGLGVGIVLDPAISVTGRGRGAFGWGGAYGTESWTEPELDYVGCFFLQQVGERPQSRPWIEAVRAALAH